MKLKEIFKKKDNNSNDQSTTVIVDHSKEIQDLFAKSMYALENAKTLEEKEQALEVASKNYATMQRLDMDWENELFTSLDKEIQKARAEFKESSDRIERDISSLETRINNLENTPAAKSIQSRVRKEANSLAVDMFNRQYKDIIAMRNEISARKFFEENGLGTTSMSKYTSGFYETINEYEKKYLFLPFLLEKKAYGMLSKEEEKELEDMESWAIASGMTKKNSYTQALENLHALGVIDIRNEMSFIQTFDENHLEYRDRESIATYAEFRNNNINNSVTSSKQHSSR